MYSKKVAIIPARRNSKRLPEKNKKLLCKKPLILYTLEQAIKSNVFTDIIISTDDEDIIEICNAFKNNNRYLFTHQINIHRRPERLAQDNIPIENVILYELARYNDDTIVVLLQPTSPLRIPYDIQVCMYKFQLASSKYTVVPVFREDNLHFKLNGSIFVIKLGTLRLRKRILDDTFLLAYIMPKERSIDIDTIEDFKEAERLMKLSLEKEK